VVEDIQRIRVNLLSDLAAGVGSPPDSGKLVNSFHQGDSDREQEFARFSRTDIEDCWACGGDRYRYGDVGRTRSR
jgi:hypothetical protein